MKIDLVSHFYTYVGWTPISTSEAFSAMGPGTL